LLDREDDNITLKVIAKSPSIQNAKIKVHDNKFFTITIDKKYLNKNLKGNYGFKVSVKDNKHPTF
jgi:hypothetical protein